MLVYEYNDKLLGSPSHFFLKEDPTVENLQKIAPECTENEIGIVKINDLDEAKSYGLDDKMPVILYFENKVTLIIKIKFSLTYFTRNFKPF